ncbi:hypothetical protein [Nocardioides nanhaiensis]|uniref:4'-phosphopantetheinyl transferase n=1 Tax=Nocardioides nanhaiensis TaxID=1476871 RepID=A0ABP8VXV0_9ACTN
MPSDVEVRLVERPGADLRTLRAAVHAVAGEHLGVLGRLCPHCAATTHGRPRAPGVHVSLAYAPGLAVLASSPTTPLGVDVERSDVAPPPPFTPSSWTAVEAVLKLTGEGLRRDPATVRPHDEARLLPLDLPPGFTGWLALPQR